MQPSKLNAEMLKELKRLNDIDKSDLVYFGINPILLYFLTEILKDFYPVTRTILKETNKGVKHGT
jgi:hypothetical protein